MKGIWEFLFSFYNVPVYLKLRQKKKGKKLSSVRTLHIDPPKTHLNSPPTLIPVPSPACGMYCWHSCRKGGGCRAAQGGTDRQKEKTGLLPAQRF